MNIGKCIHIPISEEIFDADNNLRSDVLRGYLSAPFKAVKASDVTITFSCLSTIANDYTIIFDKSHKRLGEMIKSKLYQNLSPADYLMDYRLTRRFTEDGLEKCSVVAYVVPRNVVTASRECILSLGKKPCGFSVAQNDIYNFASRFLKEKSALIVNLTESGITAHLVNLPENIITRNVSVGGGGESSLDILAGFSGEPAGGHTELLDIVSKLSQYHSIKYPDIQIEAIYLMGESAAESAKEALINANYPAVRLISEVCLTNLPKDYKADNLIYAAGAALGTEKRGVLNSVNLFDALNLENKPKINVANAVYNLSAFFIIVLNIAAIAGALMIQKQQMAVEQSYLDRLGVPVVMEANSQNELIDKKILANENGILVFDELRKKIEASPGFTSSIYTAVNNVKPMSVQISSFSYSEGVLNISCTTESGNPPADFVRAIDSTELFSEVTYKGFKGSADEETVTFSIICTLKGWGENESEG